MSNNTTLPTYPTFTLTPLDPQNLALRLTFNSTPSTLLYLTPLLLINLHAYLLSLTLTPTPPKALIFSSSSPQIFLSHIDLHIISAQYPLPNPADAPTLIQRLGEVYQMLQTLPTVFIAEVNGLADGAGNELLLNCDMRFAGPGARLGIPEVAGGLLHGGGLQRLTQLVGPGRAMEYMVSARGISGAEAAAIGWVNRAFGTEAELREYVDGLAKRISLFPRGGIRDTKVGVRECLNGTGSMEKDLRRVGELAQTTEAQKAISGFIERGGDQSANAFELGLPDTAVEVWE